MAPIGCSQEEPQAPPALLTWAEAELVGRLLTDNWDNLDFSASESRPGFLHPVSVGDGSSKAMGC